MSDQSAEPTMPSPPSPEALAAAREMFLRHDETDLIRCARALDAFRSGAVESLIRCAEDWAADGQTLADWTAHARARHAFRAGGTGAEGREAQDADQRRGGDGPNPSPPEERGAFTPEVAGSSPAPVSTPPSQDEDLEAVREISLVLAVHGEDGASPHYTILIGLSEQLDGISARLAAKLRERERLREALERVGSAEAFTGAMDLQWMVRNGGGGAAPASELLKRMDYARAALAAGEEGADA